MAAFRKGRAVYVFAEQVVRYLYEGRKLVASFFILLGVTSQKNIFNIYQNLKTKGEV